MERALDALEAQVRAALQAFAETGDAVQLDEAVELADRAVGHPRFADLDAAEVAMFWGLGGAARIHRARAGPDHPEGLDQAIEWFSQAYVTAASGDPNRPGYASNLATALTDRYERDGHRVDLARALGLCAEAISGLRALGRNAAVALHGEGLAYIDDVLARAVPLEKRDQRGVDLGGVVDQSWQVVPDRPRRLHDDPIVVSHPPSLQPAPRTLHCSPRAMPPCR
ncbi:MAG: hypothetical protein ACRDYX_06080 [Egibacteraceae bacterium]